MKTKGTHYYNDTLISLLVTLVVLVKQQRY